jgi:enamine deaminase RidA (YjgF/YER057c/UK114 family)
VAPGDAVGQTDFVLNQLDNFLANNGYSRDDIVRIEFTLTNEVGPDEFNAILGRFVEYFADVAVKPAAGTLRFVDALAFPGLLVEYEVWAAR